jgi:hypothetical protein
MDGAVAARLNIAFSKAYRQPPLMRDIGIESVLPYTIPKRFDISSPEGYCPILLKF